MKHFFRLIISLFFVLCACGFSVQVLGVDSEDTEVGVRRHGVVHNIAEDRKIEKAGGIYEPEGLDKYMKRRFDDVNARLNDIQNQLSRLDEQLKNIDAKLKNSERAEEKKK